MAKQLVGPIERHVEKGVLAVAGLLLIGVIARYLVTTPNQLEIQGESVTPASIDGKVGAKAADVARRLREAELPIEPVEPVLPAFEAAVDPYDEELAVAMELPRVAPLHPAVPNVGPQGPAPGMKVTLVPPEPLPQPIVETGRSIIPFTRLVGNEYMEFAETVAWATVSASFDRRKQVQAHQQQYARGRDQVLIVGTELQRRAQRADGSWSDADWESVRTLMEIPTPPPIELRQDDDHVYATADSVDAMERYRVAISEPDKRRERLRPLFPVINKGDTWHVPLWPDIPMADLRRMDDEVLNPNQPPAPVPICLYADCAGGDGGGGLTPGGAKEEPTGQDLISQLFAEGQKYYDEGKKALDEPGKWPNTNDAINAYNKWAEIVLSREASAADKARAKGLTAKAEQLQRDMNRKIERMRLEQAQGGGKSPDEGEEAPVAAARQFMPAQQVWAHDFRPGSLVGGKTYQYRMRVLLYNPYVAQPERLADPDDAKRVLLAGDWSPPSEPVFIEPIVQFFLTSSKEDRGEVSFEMYRWFDGVWVRDRAEAKVGDWVACSSRQPVPWWEGGQLTVDRPIVDFDAGMMVIDIDFHYPCRDRRRAGRDGIRLDRDAETTAVTLVDAEGNVHELVLAVDKDSPQRKNVKAKVWKPPRTTTTTKP